MTSWAERATSDKALQAFLEASIVRAGIDVQAAKVALAHAEQVIADQQQQIKALEAAVKSKGKPR